VATKLVASRVVLSSIVSYLKENSLEAGRRAQNIKLFFLQEINFLMIVLSYGFRTCDVA
jgi:hypothetical protein